MEVTGSLRVSGSITGSLFGTSSHALTASFAMNAIGGGGNTGSLMTTGSISGNTLTFTKGDGSTFNINLPLTASGDVFSFPTASTSWTVNHNMSQLYPVVQVYESSSNAVVIPDSIVPINSASLQITFKYPVAGHASVVKAGNGMSTGASTVNTGSFITTASAAGSTITFTKGDTSTFNVNVSSFPFTGSARITGSLAVTGSIQTTGQITGSNTITNETDTFTSTAVVTKMVTLTQAEYDAIATKNSNTVYIVI
jgi:hypothetical protein